MANGGEMRATTRILTGVFVALALGLAMCRFLDSDELEHAHATWLVLNGHVPFRDFFEHHHPLVWFVLAPVLAMTGESASAILVFRLLFFFLTLAIARATYLLALECSPSKDVARLAALLLLSMTTFVGVAIEIRPDVPQILFAVLSALYAVRLLRTGAMKDAVLSGSAAALSFLFLQKAVFIFAAYPAVFLYYVAQGRLPWRTGVWFTVACAGTCAPAIVYVALTGSFDDYVISNWLVNARVGANAYRVTLLAPDVVRDIARNAPFWILVGGAALTSFRRPANRAAAVPLLLGLATLGLILLLNRVVDRYLAAAIPFLAVGAAAFVDRLWSGDAHRRPIAAAILVVIVLSPGIGMVRAALRTNTSQIAGVRALLEWSGAGDRVYDYDRKINVFRKDVHYFWFRVGRVPGMYAGLSGGRRSDFDVCRVLADVAPEFVYRRRRELETCGLTGRYRATTVEDLFVRADHPLRRRD